jgi:membrane fusion protein (multidrug efflux system)
MEASKKKVPVKKVVLIVLLLVAGYFGTKKIYFSVTHETTDNAQIETQIVPVLPRVSGYVKHTDLKDFDSVKIGQLLVELDDAELQAQMAEADADLAQAKTEIINAQATLHNALSTLAVNKANVTLTQMRKKKADDDYSRDQRLLTDGAITKKQIEDSKFILESSQQQVNISNNEYTAALSRIDILKANVQKAHDAVKIKEAKIGQLQLKLSYTKVYAPLSGKIGKKNISEGQFIQAGTPLFSIVNDSTHWVVANFKENQLKSLTPGKKVEIRIDAYSDLKVTGTIASLSEATGSKFALLPADNSSGNFVKVTQRIPIKIWIDDVQQYHNMLRAGMSVFIVAEKN